MNTEVFRVALTRSEALAGDPYISDTESLQCYVTRDWSPWQIDLHRYGAIRVQLRDNHSDKRSSLTFELDQDAGREAIASAVVSYVANLGGFASSRPYGEWCGEVLDRVAGALESARAKHAEKMASIALEA